MVSESSRAPSSLTSHTHSTLCSTFYEPFLCDVSKTKTHSQASDPQFETVFFKFWTLCTNYDIVGDSPRLDVKKIKKIGVTEEKNIKHFRSQIYTTK